MHLFLNLFIGKQPVKWASSRISLRLARPALALLTRLWGSLPQPLIPLRAGLALVASAVLLSFTSAAQTFKAVPLDCGGWFSGFAQADNGRLYGYGDVFGAWRSDDGGSSWNYLNWSIPGGDFYGTGMAVQKNNADVVYYCTSYALRKSTNGGATWSLLLDVGEYDTPRFRGSSPILIRSNNPNEIWFAGPRKNMTGWLWKSSNGGVDWVKAGGSNFDSNRARTLHNVAAFANQIWVGSDDGLYVSTDGGNNFSLVGGSGSLREVGMIARFTTGSFAGVGLVTRSDGGYAGGISRITATNYNDATTYSVSAAATGPFFLGYPSGLQIFSDGSASAWNTGADIHAFSAAGNGGQLFTKRATTLNTSVVPIWTTAAALAARNTPDYGTDQVIEAVGNPNKWMITGGGAPMYSLDKGLSWQYFPNGSGLAAVKTYLAGVSRYDVNRIYVPGSDIGSAIITDGGNSGQATFSSYRSYNGLHSTFRVLEGPNTQNLVLAGVDQGASATLILKSSNGGASWNVVSQTGNGLPRSLDGITKSVMSFTDANDFLVVLASGTAHSDPIPPGSINPGVWRTTNGGASFTQVQDLPTTGLKTGFRYGPSDCFIERDAVQPDVRYFIARDAPFYRSTNGGTNWTPRTHPYNGAAWAWDLHADPVRGGNLWAAGDYAGVKVSRDGGQSWNATAQYINARLVSSCDGKIAVFGSKTGDANPRLYYSDDDGVSFRALTSPNYNFHGVQGITVDRTGKVWVSWNSVTVVNPATTVTGTPAPSAQPSSAVQVYPNPAAGSFSVSTGKEGATITVRTLAGKVISTRPATGTLTRIDAGNWPSGMYLVQVQAGTETTVKKLVIAK
ncbi:T9SS type A sorting domain-containing protein [Hymenobacter sp. BT664]|uniref:T9SS type A sorting domain-containing protein n=1 Tax=Hymenobacter montanus TaxID=2771359 RepID=A0A927GJD8_9BACT|nr:T9SS type A sorting domain-containing protein [Hymenobacter montanus]MBD2768011.1 T9SS type A sorting domain-containing protein [Hymenobacter montanus]